MEFIGIAKKNIWIKTSQNKHLSESTRQRRQDLSSTLRAIATFRNNQPELKAAARA